MVHTLLDLKGGIMAISAWGDGLRRQLGVHTYVHEAPAVKGGLGEGQCSLKGSTTLFCLGILRF